MPRGRIRVKLKSYDHRVLDNTCESLLDTALRTGAKIVGPIPLPTKRERITVLTSPHTDKDSREAFEVKTHKRIFSQQFQEHAVQKVFYKKANLQL